MLLTTQPPEFEIKEGKTTRITGTLTQEDQVTPLPGSLLTSLVLTIYDTDHDQTLIVDHRDILNANNGTVDETGRLTVLLSTADVPIRTASLPFERHVCLFEWTWGVAPVKTAAAEVILVVRNLGKVP